MKTQSLFIAVTFCTSVLFGQEALVPCTGRLASDPTDLVLAARLIENLKIDSRTSFNEGFVYARAFLPYFDGKTYHDAVVTVYAPDTLPSDRDIPSDDLIDRLKRRNGLIVATIAIDDFWRANLENDTSRQLTSEKHLVKVKDYRVAIPQGLSYAICKTFAEQITAARFPDGSKLPIVIHGVRYTFSTFIFGIGTLCAETLSPPEGTPAADMVQFAQTILQYATADADRREGIYSKMVAQRSGISTANAR